MSIAALGTLLRSGAVTPSGLVYSALERVARLEPALNAFADTMAEAVVRDAEQRTRELAAGQDFGPLHGIPVAIKDIIDVAGAPTGWGTRARAPALPSTDAKLVARLRAEGAVIFGKTNMLEYAYGVPHPQIGQTNNPHDVRRTAGGSSGGSAAAVAAGIVPLAIGTDTGGSIRIPAAYCGVVGLKPSFGAIPMTGVFPLSPSLDHAGPLARSVADAAIALGCLTATALPREPLSLSGLRIGLVPHHWQSAEIEPGVLGCLDAVLRTLEAAGAQVRTIHIAEIERANAALITILQPEASLVHAELLETHREGYAPQTRAQLEAGFMTKATDYLAAKELGRKLRQGLEDAFATVDILASPSVAFVAPFEDPVLGQGGEGEILTSGLANLTGHPAISLPAGSSQGMPVGLQLIGPLGRDGHLLQAALAVEAALLEA